MLRVITGATGKYASLVLSIVIGALLFFGSGCANQGVAPTPVPAIQYNIDSAIQLQKMTWSLPKLEGTEWLQFEMELKSTASTNQTFEVGIQADDSGMVYSGPLLFQPGKTQTVKLMTVLHTIQPKKLLIQVIPAKPLPIKPPKPQ